MKISEGLYRGLNSITLETGKMKVTLLAEYGAKMVSIVNIQTGYEFLWQNKNKEDLVPVYDSNYADGNLSGMDEMFPTINECFYPSDPWRGIKMPDHGELWSIPWDYEIKYNKLHMWVYGVRLPYRFEKWLYFIDKKVLRTDYKITNLSSFDMDFIWAAHPLFNMEEGSRIVLPDCVDKIINTLNFKNRLGKTGNIHTWPITFDRNGNTYDLSTILPRTSGVCEKFYTKDMLVEGWAKLVLPRINENLTFEFPTDKVPYIGIWINQDGLRGQYNMALEPATGALDDIYLSNMWENNSRIEAKGTYEFWINTRIG